MIERAQVLVQIGTPLDRHLRRDGWRAVYRNGDGPRSGGRAGRRSAHYGAGAGVRLDAGTATRAPALPARRGVPASGGAHLTWHSRFAQSDTICAGRSAEGLRTVDMKAATVAAMAQRIGRRAVALLNARDAL